MKKVLLLELDGVEEIEEALNKLEGFIPKKYKSNNEKFLEKLENAFNN